LSTVIDSSVVVAALVDDGAQGAWAESVLANGPLYAPELVCAEVSNVLRRLEKAKLISVADANAGHDDLMRLDILLFPFEPFADRIWELRHKLTSYDAWYVALAEALRLPFATLDAALSRSRGIACEFLTPKR
jgi:predicted nucleic acid-binding protein